MSANQVHISSGHTCLKLYNKGKKRKLKFTAASSIVGQSLELLINGNQPSALTALVTESACHHIVQRAKQNSVCSEYQMNEF
eukprot:scaffold22100_cov15-Prasinocladus_malaysianus.AAC.1